MTDLSFARGQTLRVSLGPSAATVNLTPGVGVHRFAITADILSEGLVAGLPIQLTGEVHVELDHTNRWLGPLHGKQLTTRNFPGQEQLTCGLSDSQVQVIEALRNGRDLSFRLHLNAVLLHPVDGLYPVAEAQEVARLPAEAWARQLEALGAAVTVEVLVPLPLDGGECRRAVSRIREAKGHITDGKYEEAVIKVRAALDYLREVVPPNPKTLPVARERTQAQRWRVLIDDLYSLASGANHDDEVTANFSWNREDAVMIVAAVAGLLGRSANAGSS